MHTTSIVFFGTPDFAVASLKALFEAGFPIAAAVTAPDKPAGRGRQLKGSAVKEYALAQGIPVLQPEKLKDPDFLKQLHSLDADLFVVVAFRMLPEAVWAMPRLGTFNLHASLLPAYRGAAPINWAIINGEPVTGVTSFLINHEIDTGAVLMQKKLEIAALETAGSLHDRLMVLGGEVVVETAEALEKGSLTPVPQPYSPDLPAAPKIYREDLELFPAHGYLWNLRRILGMSPFPGAYLPVETPEGAMDLKILLAEPNNISLTKEGIYLHQQNLVWVLPGGVLNLLEVQAPGKRAMAAMDWWRGTRWDEIQPA